MVCRVMEERPGGGAGRKKNYHHQKEREEKTPHKETKKWYQKREYLYFLYYHHDVAYRQYTVYCSISYGSVCYIILQKYAMYVSTLIIYNIIIMSNIFYLQFGSFSSLLHHRYCFKLQYIFITIVPRSNSTIPAL